MEFLTDPVGFLDGLLRGLFTGWGLSPGLTQFLLFAIGAGFLAMISLVWVILLIWVERKIYGRIQDRLGPNRVGPFGIIQPIADMIKIFTKEHITPKGVDPIPYNLAPVLAVVGVMLVWAVVPFGHKIYGVDLSVGVLFVVAVAALGELGIVMAGWGSNNKYALLGAFRVIALLISYEVPMVLALLLPVLFSGSMGLVGIVEGQTIWYIVLAPVAGLIFFITSLAEVGRAPFDLAEAESELVAGFNIEYSGLKFGFFFVGEFLHAFTAALLFAVLFLGGWRGPGAEQYPLLGLIYLLVKTSLGYFLIVMARVALPRFRIDQMMAVAWKLLTPLALAALMSTALLLKAIPAGQVVFRVIGFLVLNALLLLATDWLLRRAYSRKERPVVAPQPRPIARSERGGV